MPKKTSPAEEFSRALLAPSAVDAMKPFLDPIPEMLGALRTRPELLEAWGGRVTKEIEESNYEAVGPLVTAGCQQLLPFITSKPKNFLTSALLRHIPAWHSIPIESVSSVAALRTVLALSAELLGCNPISTTLFPLLKEALLRLMGGSKIPVCVRREAAETMLAAVESQQSNKDLVDLGEMLRTFQEADDFHLQEITTAILRKCSYSSAPSGASKKKKLASSIANMEGVLAETHKLLASSGKSEFGAMDFVLKYNKTAENPKVYTLCCTEWHIKGESFVGNNCKDFVGPDGLLHIHAGLSRITFALPTEEDHVNWIDIPYSDMVKLSVKESHTAIITFRDAHLQGKFAHLAEDGMVTLTAKCSSPCQEWVHIVAPKIKESISAMKKATASKSEVQQPVTDEATPPKGNTKNDVSPSSEASSLFKTSKVKDRKSAMKGTGAKKKDSPLVASQPRKREASKRRCVITDSDDDEATPPRKVVKEDKLAVTKAVHDELPSFFSTKAKSVPPSTRLHTTPVRKVSQSEARAWRPISTPETTLKMAFDTDDSSDGTGFEEEIDQLQKTLTTRIKRQEQHGREELEELMDAVQEETDEVIAVLDAKQAALKKTLDETWDGLKDIMKEMSSIHNKEKALTRDVQEAHMEFVEEYRGKKRELAEVCQFAERVQGSLREAEETGLREIVDMANNGLALLRKKVHKKRPRDNVVMQMLTMMTNEMVPAP